MIGLYSYLRVILTSPNTYSYIGIGVIIIYIIRKIFNGPATCLSRDMTGKIVLITGPSAGI
jgi:hypothetical protein